MGVAEAFRSLIVNFKVPKSPFLNPRYHCATVRLDWESCKSHGIDFLQFRGVPDFGRPQRSRRPRAGFSVSISVGGISRAVEIHSSSAKVLPIEGSDVSISVGGNSSTNS